MKKRKQFIINASEVGEYLYCAKAWQLKRDGVEPEGERLAAGTNFHRQHSERISFAEKVWLVGWIFIVLALALFFIGLGLLR